MQNGLAICAKRAEVYGKRQLLLFEEFAGEREERARPSECKRAWNQSRPSDPREHFSAGLCYARKPLLRSCIVSDTRGDDWRGGAWNKHSRKSVERVGDMRDEIG